VPDGEIRPDDPRAPDVRALLQRHLEFARMHTPREYSFALDVDGLLDPALTMFSFRAGQDVLAVGALRHLNAAHAEVKSMHTAEAARGRGIGRAMLEHLIGVARARGYSRISLETGSTAAFGPARALYVSAGFQPCGPFADYAASPWSAFMTLSVSQPREMA
jgi:putative acetyltransferase